MSELRTSYVTWIQLRSAIENTRIERWLAVIVLSFFQSDQRRDVHETRH